MPTQGLEPLKPEDGYWLVRKLSHSSTNSRTWLRMRRLLDRSESDPIGSSFDTSNMVFLLPNVQKCQRSQFAAQERWHHTVSTIEVEEW
jgi:hypothetical protein